MHEAHETAKKKKESEENVTYPCLNGKRGPTQSEYREAGLWRKTTKGGSPGLVRRNGAIARYWMCWRGQRPKLIAVGFLCQIRVWARGAGQTGQDRDSLAQMVVGLQDTKKSACNGEKIELWVKKNRAASGSLTGWCGTVRGGKLNLQGGKSGL